MKIRRIEITKIKHVKSLTFDVPSPGVHVLTGRNGSGKTTLLAALYRLKFSNAFAQYFRTTSANPRLDNYAGGCVTYVFGDKSVSYNYRNTRWAPTPKSNSYLLGKFGFPKVVFIAANAKRIEPTGDELHNLRVKPVAGPVCDAVAKILSDARFRDLRYIHTKRGKGNRAFLLPISNDRKPSYYSEKNFSLGELCVVKLVSSIDLIPAKSLILIDEIEMALHPRAQSRLLDYLVEVSAQKDLTVIFSTHSASLIKRAGRKRLLWLEERENGKTTCVANCYPAQALGDIAFEEELTPDVLIFVEDDYAKSVFQQMIDHYKRKRTEDEKAFPVCRVVPVGGFKEVLSFLKNSDQIFAASVRRVAVLDKDVEEESLKDARERNRYAFLSEYESLKERVSFLPCTPELGFCDLLSSDVSSRAAALRRASNWSGVDIEGILLDAKIDRPWPLQSNKRKIAKQRLQECVAGISKKTGEPEADVIRKIAFFYVAHLAKNSEALLMRAVGSALD